jgi:hypothetical protein
MMKHADRKIKYNRFLKLDRSGLERYLKQQLNWISRTNINESSAGATVKIEWDDSKVPVKDRDAENHLENTLKGAGFDVSRW